MMDDETVSLIENSSLALVSGRIFALSFKSIEVSEMVNIEILVYFIF